MASKGAARRTSLLAGLEFCQEHGAFRDAVSVSYQIATSCDQSGVCDDGFCRCGEIENERVRIEYPVLVAQEIVDAAARRAQVPRERRLVELYALERALARIDLTPSDYRVRIEGGFYGEEVTGVSLGAGARRKLEEACARIDAAPGSKLIELILEDAGARERAGDLRGLRFAVERLPLERITIPDELRAEPLDEEAIERHSKTQERIGRYRSLPNRSGRERRALADLPQAIAVKRGKRLRLVDGRHRLEAANRAGLDELSVLVGRRG